MTAEHVDGAGQSEAHNARRIAQLEDQVQECQATVASLEQRVADQAKSIENLNVALATSRRIGAAVGIVMSLIKVTEDQAFNVLRVVSQRRNVKLRDVADGVVETGTIDEE